MSLYSRDRPGWNASSTRILTASPPTSLSGTSSLERHGREPARLVQDLRQRRLLDSSCHPSGTIDASRAAAANSASACAIELDPEPGRLPERRAGRRRRRAVVHKLLAQPRLAQLGGQELEERHLRRHHRQLGGDRDRDPGLPRVRHDEQVALRPPSAHTRRASVRPPTRPMSGCATSTQPRSSSWANSWRVVSHSPWAIRTGERRAQLRIAVEVVDPQRRLEEEHVVVARSPRRCAAPAGPSRTRTARRPSASSRARPPRAPRGPPPRSTRRAPDRPLCAYGPENVASSLAARNPISRALVAQPTIDSR